MRIATIGHPALPIMTALLSAALVVAACGGDDDGDATATATSPERATRTPRSTADESETPEPEPANTLADIELDEFVIRPTVTRARPGTVAFTISNAGEVAHEFVVIKSDLPVAELPRREDDAGADENEVEVVDRTENIEPGNEAELSVPVEEGKYVLICNIFTAGESHYLNGMYNLFTVDPSAPAPSPTRTP